MKTIEIHTLDDPRVGDYANLRDFELLQQADPFDPTGHRGLFVAEGELVVRRLIESRFVTKSVFLTPTRLRTMSDALERLPTDVLVYVASGEVLSGVVGFNIHRGVLAIGIRPREEQLEDLLARRNGVVLILEDLFNHDNIGSIFRNAAALGGTNATILLTHKTADPLYRKCVRVSVGNVLSIEFGRLRDWPKRDGEDARALQQIGIETWGMTIGGEGVVEIEQAVRRWRQQTESGDKKRIALVMGSEGPGLTDQAKSMCDRLVTIPMYKAHENVDSLNVAVAAAIGLYELGKSR